MFPYEDNGVSWWTGYFSSRPNAKSEARGGSRNFHASAQMGSLSVLKSTTSDDEVKDILDAKDHMLDALGIYQHHDAITGTAK